MNEYYYEMFVNWGNTPLKYLFKAAGETSDSLQNV